MAKKSRRAKRRAEKRRGIAAVRPKPAVSVPSPAVAKEEIESQAEEKTAQLAEEYRYVYSDLKRVAILAASMLALLIILSFVIR